MTEKQTISEIIYRLDNSNPESVALTDSLLSTEINTISDIKGLGYCFSHSELVPLLPKTGVIINKLLQEEIKTLNSSWYSISTFVCWMDTNTKAACCEAWLDGKDFHLYHIKKFLPDCVKINKVGIRSIEKAIQKYKTIKSLGWTEIIDLVFTFLPDEDLDAASELLAASTPAVQVCLLKREGIKEEYLMKAIKALGKLSSQKRIMAKLDFNLLGKLSPVSRLKVMQQMLGVLDWSYINLKHFNDNKEKYSSSTYRSPAFYEEHYKSQYDTYAKQKEMPFKEMPKREDVEIFLFPCLLKYNKEVSDLIARYDELISLIGPKEGDKKLVTK